MTSLAAQTKKITLDQAKAGDNVLIQEVKDPETAAYTVRLGISKGETLCICGKIPGGPIIVCRGNVEIALGRELCKSIEVTVQ